MTSRFAWPAAVLLALALVPTVANVYLRPADEDPGALAADFGAALPGQPAAAAGPRDADWCEAQFGTRACVSRTYGDLELFAARTLDAKKLFHFPELALSYGHAATATRDIRLDGGTPARAIEFETSRDTRVALYVLLCGRDAVADPYAHLMRSLPTLMLGDRKPWTIVYVQGAGGPGDTADLKARLRALLAAAHARLATE